MQEFAIKAEEAIDAQNYIFVEEAPGRTQTLVNNRESMLHL